MNTSGENAVAQAIFKAADDVTYGSDAVKSADDDNSGEVSRVGIV